MASQGGSAAGTASDGRQECLPHQKDTMSHEAIETPAPVGRAQTASASPAPSPRPSPVSTWVWFILKNVIGWVLIIAAFPLGAMIPGPGGIPLFLIGFGLITFPGKRHLTARVLRGIPVPRGSRQYRFAVGLLAIVFPAIVLVFLIERHWIDAQNVRANRWSLLAGYIAAAAVLCVVGFYSHPVVNKILRAFPIARRKVRPWLRRRGIDLLPARRRRRRHLHAGHAEVPQPNPEILEFDERHVERVRNAWSIAKPWVKRTIGFAITVAIFVLICRPIIHRWNSISDRIATISWGRFFTAAAMFASFLFVFRAMVWRRILIGFGHYLPVAPATRIWSTSELARYLPGVIWQVWGRQYLAKPYGVRGSHVSASQILELVIFLLANLLIAIASLVWLGFKNMHGPARTWMIVALALVPVLTFLLHPRVLYRLMNGILRRLKKPGIVPRMGFGTLAGLLLWSLIGIVWQSMAIWLLVEEPLGGLQLAKWWVVAGSYCLAWCAGFLAFWAQGGLGVRELVFIGALTVALPPAVRKHFPDHEQLIGVIMFLSVLLRLWATAGEMILAAFAYVFDWRGAMRGGGTKAAPAPSRTPEPAR
jgi:hypothetical protein